MNFLKRYYDKVILLVFFVLFVVLMLSVLSIIDETRDVKPEDLQLPERVANYKDEDGKPELPEALWKKSALIWNKTNEDKDASDLIQPEKLAVCPYCAERTGVQVLIPISAFGGKCPHDGKELKKPTADQLAGRLITANDSDGDGISNEDERKYGLNPEDERDANYDSDGDGFSNLYEITQKTAPNNANDHPPLWQRLKLQKVSTIKLPIELKIVNTNNSPDKSRWDIQYNLPRTHRRTRKVQTKSYFVTLGEEIQVDENDKRRYAIVDVRHWQDPKQKAADKSKTAVKTAANNGNSRETSNVGRFVVELQEVVDPGRKEPPEKITMITGEPVYSSDLRPVFEDTGRPGSRPVVRRIGTEIVMFNIDGRRRTDMEVLHTARYVVLEAKNKALGVEDDTAVIGIIDPAVKDPAKMEKITITAGKHIIPHAARVIQQTEENKTAVEE